MEYRKNHVEERIIIDFKEIDSKFLFKIGKVNQNRAVAPMSEHVHPNSIEVVHMIKGSQSYSVGLNNYTVNTEEVFISFPDELHSTGTRITEKSALYYVIINMAGWGSFSLCYNEDEEKELWNRLRGMKKRVFLGNQKMVEILNVLLDLGEGNSPFKKTFIRNLMIEYLIELITCEGSKNEEKILAMEEVVEYIKQHVNEDIKIATLARIVNLSESRFKMNFRKEFGVPPKEYILRKKVKRAKELLESEKQSMTDIAFELGFSSSQYFSTVFKRFMGITPNEYRRKLQGESNE